MHQKLFEYYLNDLSPEETEKFELHLLECQSCRDEIARLDRAFKIMQHDKDHYEKKLSLPEIINQRVLFLKKMTRYAIAAAFILATSLSLYAYLIKPEYYDLAKLTDEQELITLKSDATMNEFDEALNLLRNKEYDRALTRFQNYFTIHPHHHQANYFLGLAHLAVGEKDFLWYHRFSDQHSRASIRYLESAKTLAGDNQFYQEDCLWLLGKAWLRLGDVAQAKQAWRSIVNLPSPDLIHKEEARLLLNEIE